MFRRAISVISATILLTTFLTTPATAGVNNYNCSGGTYQVDNVTKVLTGHTSCSGVLNINSFVTSIAANAFINNVSLTNVTIPGSVTTIGASAFQGTKLTSLTFNEGLVTIGSMAFKDVTTNVTPVAINFPDSLVTIEGNAFAGSRFKSYSIGSNVATIGDSAFFNNSATGATSIVFRGISKVTSINSYVFLGYQGSELTLPPLATSLGQRVFESSPNLDNLLIPESVTSIATIAFQTMPGLKFLVLPDRLTTMGLNAFNNTNNLKTIYYCGSASAIQNYTYPNSIAPECLRAAFFRANGGIGTMAPDTGTVTAALKANTFTRSGYVFAGWNTKPDGTGISYSDQDDYPFTTSENLYAQWALPDLTAPVFSAPTSRSMAENNTTVGPIVVNEASTISIVGGDDQAKLTLTRIRDTATTLSFINPPNFEAPTDIGSNNTYIVVLKAEDLSANEKLETFTVTVTNVVDSFSLLSTSITRELQKGVPTVISITVDAASYGTFFAQGKRMARCIKKTSNASRPYTINCTWTPTIMTGLSLSVRVTPKGGNSLSTTFDLGGVGVGYRTNKR